MAAFMCTIITILSGIGCIYNLYSDNADMLSAMFFLIILLINALVIIPIDSDEE